MSEQVLNNEPNLINSYRQFYSNMKFSIFRQCCFKTISLNYCKANYKSYFSSLTSSGVKLSDAFLVSKVLTHLLKAVRPVYDGGRFGNRYSAACASLIGLAISSTLFIPNSNTSIGVINLVVMSNTS